MSACFSSWGGWIFSYSCGISWAASFTRCGEGGGAQKTYRAVVILLLRSNIWCWSAIQGQRMSDIGGGGRECIKKALLPSGCTHLLCTILSWQPHARADTHTHTHGNIEESTVPRPQEVEAMQTQLLWLTIRKKAPWLNHSLSKDPVSFLAESWVETLKCWR